MNNEMNKSNSFLSNSRDSLFVQQLLKSFSQQNESEKRGYFEPEDKRDKIDQNSYKEEYGDIKSFIYKKMTSLGTNKEPMMTTCIDDTIHLDKSSQKKTCDDVEFDKEIEEKEKEDGSLINHPYLYICHFCLQYKTNKRNDMNKHLTKMKKCQLTYIPHKMLTFETSANASLNKRFYFLFDHSKLTFQDYIYIVNHFHNPINYINYTDIIQNNPFIKNKCDDLIPKHEVNKVDKAEEVEDEANEKKFSCTLCGKEYKSKQSLLKHIQNKTLCKHTQLINKMLKETEQKNITELIEHNQTLQQTISNSFNQNNVNIQNNYNNSSPEIKLDVKDFGCESYTYSHIPKSYIKQDDFYLYTNFLNKLLENEKNQNILFMNGNEDIKSENRKAIIYADEILYKINEDKAIFMIMQKLSITMKNIMSNIYKSDKDKEKIAEIERYYRVITGHFKHDTIFKNYHIDDKQFYNLTHKRRSRDVYTAKIRNIVQNHGTPISQITNSNYNQPLETFYPDIEDYASTRVRNKDLKKRKDELPY